MPATVLVVDDDPVLRDRLALALRETGHRLLMAGNALEALAHLATGPVDVVLSDQGTPGLDGHAFLQLVRDLHPATLRVMLVDHLDPRTALKAITSGEVFQLLLKPVDPFELRVALHLGLEKLALERELRRLAALVRAPDAAAPRTDPAAPGPCPYLA